MFEHFSSEMNFLSWHPKKLQTIVKRKTIIIVIFIAKIIIIVIHITSSAADSMGAVGEGRLLPHQHNANHA